MARTLDSGPNACISESGAAPCTDGAGLGEPRTLAVTPDNRSVYVGSQTSSSIAIFDRDPVGGALTQKDGSAGCVSLSGAFPCATGLALQGPDDLALSPDGRSLYGAAIFGGGGLSIFDRSIIPITLSVPSVLSANQTVGSTSAAQPVTVTNSGPAPWTLSAISITGANPGQFQKSNGTCVIGQPLAAGASCTATVSFSPTDTNLRTANLRFASDAPGSPQDVGLSGTGVIPTFSVTPKKVRNQVAGEAGKAKIKAVATDAFSQTAVGNVRVKLIP